MKAGEIWYIKILMPNCVMTVEEVEILDVTAQTIQFRQNGALKGERRYLKSDVMFIEEVD